MRHNASLTRLPFLSDAFILVRVDLFGMVRSAKAYGDYDPIVDLDRWPGQTVFHLTADPELLVRVIWCVTSSGNPCSVAFNARAGALTAPRIARIYAVPGACVATAHIYQHRSNFVRRKSWRW